MKKSLVVLAALGFVGVACAQSSVTLFGVVDADVSHYSQGGISKTMQGSSGNSPSQLGFRGTEDLGGDLSANFWLEATLLSNSGSGLATGGGLSFSRRSTVSVAGDFGEVRLGRDFSPSYWNHVMFSAFGTVGPGAGSSITQGGTYAVTKTFNSNAIQYLWGYAPNAMANVGRGVYAQLMYAFPGTVSGQPALNQYAGGRLGYAAGPLNAAVSYAQSKGTPYPVDALAGYSTYKEFNLGGSYDFGVAKLMAHVGTNNSDAAGTKYTHWGLGTRIIAGPGYIPVSFNSIKQNNASGSGANELAVGYVYFLSKRTALYATAARIHNKNNGTYTFVGGNGSNNPQFSAVHGFTYGNGTGYDVGVRTSF
ncbi:MAG: porin [Rhodoferax sp.]